MAAFYNTDDTTGNNTIFVIDKYHVATSDGCIIVHEHVYPQINTSWVSQYEYVPVEEEIDDLPEIEKEPQEFENAKNESRRAITRMKEDQEIPLLARPPPSLFIFSIIPPKSKLH